MCTKRPTWLLSVSAGVLLVATGCGGAGLPQEDSADPLAMAGMSEPGLTLPFAAPPEQSGRLPGKAAGLLSDEERNQLNTLRTRLDAGELSPADFAVAVDELLGDRFARRARPGGLFVRQRLARALGLTPEQIEQSRTLAQEGRRAARRLHLETRATIRLLLTAEQRDQLDEARAQCVGAGRPGMPGGWRGGPDDAVFQNRKGNWGGPRGWHGGGFRRGAGFQREADSGPRGAQFRQRAEQFRDCMIESLALTEDQQALIRAAREGAREQLRTLRESGRAQFEALLTPEQLEQLAALRERWQERPDRPGLHRGNRPWDSAPVEE